MKHCDYLMIGAGIAGASAAYELCAHGNVVLLERERMPGYHSTGRSAAVYMETYGLPVIRALTIGSRPFFENPPLGLTGHPLLQPRGVLWIGRADQLHAEFRRRKVNCDHSKLIITVGRSASTGPELVHGARKYAFRLDQDQGSRPDRRLRSDDVLHKLTELFTIHGPPEQIRSDNGSEFTAHAVRDWLKRVGVKTL